MPKGKKNEPVHEYRLGRILGLVWLNENGEGRSFHNVQVFRLYKDGDKWERTTTYGRDDLPLVCKVVDHCHTWIHEVWQDKDEAGNTESDDDSAAGKKSAAA